KGGAVLGTAHLPVVVTVLLCVALAVAGSLTLVVPTILGATGLPPVVAALRRLKDEMITHNAVIMTVLFAVLAATEASHLIHQLTA
ncbi:hypothetical protein ACTUQ0_14775, partial [Listeria monocytogenes]|uniref:hypothetical protein n=1 Tax=Listeria monocytogenes TaxID=1639 RepID=UPI003FA46EBF